MQQRVRWLDGITDSMDMSLSKFQDTKLGGGKVGFRSNFGLSSGEDDLKGGRGPGSRAGRLICVNSKDFYSKRGTWISSSRGLGKLARNTKPLALNWNLNSNQIPDHSLALDSWRSLGLKNDEGKAGQSAFWEGDAQESWELGLLGLYRVTCSPFLLPGQLGPGAPANHRAPLGNLPSPQSEQCSWVAEL